MKSGRNDESMSILDLMKEDEYRTPDPAPFPAGA
jgi:hypothetical protein